MSGPDIDLKRVPANPVRGAVSLCTLIVLCAGAWIAWGFGVALFVCGLVFYLDVAVDEVIERVTLVKRGWK